ncbi:MAG: hypothetical protein ACRBF0_14975 [Calditrichia bacterium]
MFSLNHTPSSTSRTNQLIINESTSEVAEKLVQYLFKKGKGIEHFSINGWFAKEEYSKKNFYIMRHQRIKDEIRRRLAEYGEAPILSEIQYFFSRSNGQNLVFYLSPSRQHSGWKKLFSDQWQKSNRERIFNLIFKVHLISQELPVETLNGFEELLFIHSAKSNKKGDVLYVWGQNLFVNYNHFNVLTLTLNRKFRKFLSSDTYGSLDEDDLGELMVFESRKYHHHRDEDARRKNDIFFMRFESGDEEYKKFKKTQLYYYQTLMTKLQEFLSECKIAFDALPYTATHFLENPFIKNIESVESLKVINNTGFDLTIEDQQFLQNFLSLQGVVQVTLHNAGKSISSYEKMEDEDEGCWKITELVPWDEVELNQQTNYLVLNRLLDEEIGSMAYQKEDGLWYPSNKLKNEQTVDFYTRIKSKYNYLKTGKFISTQGVNLDKFLTVGSTKSSLPVLSFSEPQIRQDDFYNDIKPLAKGKHLSVSESIASYSREQSDPDKWNMFLKKHKIKISPEYQKVLIELGIKNWIRESLCNHVAGLPISTQTFDEKSFYSIYVRSPRKQDTRAVAVEFVYKDGAIFIRQVISELRQIQEKFKFLKTRRNSDTLVDNQQYFVDATDKLYVSCYTDDYFTPTLIGRDGILDEMKSGTLKVNRQVRDNNSSRILPLVTHYNEEMRPINRIRKLICFDLANDSFIQYFVPPGKSIEARVKKGFRVYHMIGKSFTNEPILTSELIEHPITSLHFNTLTHNILRISDNSQSSLLQKVARVLVEN